MGFRRLTWNKQTVTELYTVDEHVRIDPSSPAPPARVLPALQKTSMLAPCETKWVPRAKKAIIFLGQATDVALLMNALFFNFPNPRQVGLPPNCAMPLLV